uniref:glutathione transferase n=1 Tax=Plectus sambesii TaxID=2011161 RepID=A0A914V701_9BILA
MPIIPQYTLTYFNLMGRAEPIRLIFAQARVNYKDHRIERSEWPALKEKMPFSQLPVLEMDGKVLAQSHAIEKFLARMFGLDGKDDWESAKIDECVMGLEDLLQKMVPWFRETDEVKKIEIFKKLVSDEINPFLERYQKFLVDNGSGYFVGTDLTYADLSLFNTLHFMNTKLLPGHLKNYSRLNEFVDKIAALPNIKAWLETRPKTDH